LSSARWSGRGTSTHRGARWHPCQHAPDRAQISSKAGPGGVSRLLDGARGCGCDWTGSSSCRVPLSRVTFVRGAATTSPSSC